MDLALYFLIKRFLVNQNYPINSEELKLQLLSHPSYPSLHSVTGLLNHLGIENIALEVPKDIETLKELPDIFLSITSSQEYILVQKQEEHIELLFDNKDKKNVTISEFLTIWSGIIVAIEKKDSNEIGKSGPYAQKNIPYYLLAIIAIGLFFFTKPMFFNSIHFILSLIGLTISVLIVKHELGYKSNTIEKLCSSNKSSSCDAVLNSTGASISKYVKLSDACLIYFVSVTLYWLLTQSYSIPQSIIAVPSILSILVTPVSIYYQSRVIKKWCPLCVSITGVLWLQFFSLFINMDIFQNLNFELSDSLSILISFLFVSVAWSFIRPFINRSLELNKLYISHYKFIRNFDLFVSALNKSKTIDTDIDEIGGIEIVLGNRNAPLSILLVTNPQCYYCKKAHFDLEKILSKHAQDISITIRFSVNTVKDNIGLKIAQRLLELYNSPQIEQFKSAIQEAYSEEANLEKWIEKWEAPKIGSYLNVLEKEKNWCLDHKTNFTPALYVNGKEYPKEYEREHLSYFIEELTELSNTVLENIEQLEMVDD